MTGVAEGVLGLIKIAVPTVSALIEVSSLVKSSWDLFQNGSITKDDMLEQWKANGVELDETDAALGEAMEAARKRHAAKL